MIASAVPFDLVRLPAFPVLAAHSQDFLNGVCTHIIWLTQRKLIYYTGNYDTFKKTVAENEVGCSMQLDRVAACMQLGHVGMSSLLVQLLGGLPWGCGSAAAAETSCKL